MDEYNAFSGSVGSSVAKSSLSDLASGTSAGLRALLAEVTALANQLRKGTTLMSRPDNAHQAGWNILQTLGQLGPQTVPDIARARALSRQSIQVLVNRLESQGYVEVTPNPAHKRSGLVQLTDRGRRLLVTVTEREATSLESLLPHLSRSSLAPATRLLRQLRELLAGKELPPEEIAGERPAHKAARKGRGLAPRREAALTTAEPQTVREPIAPEEGELPVSLL